MNWKVWLRLEGVWSVSIKTVGCLKLTSEQRVHT